MIPNPGETGGAWWENTGQSKAYAELAAAQGRVVGDEFDSAAVFLHDVPDDVVASDAGPWSHGAVGHAVHAAVAA